MAAPKTPTLDQAYEPRQGLDDQGSTRIGTFLRTPLSSPRESIGARSVKSKRATDITEPIVKSLDSGPQFPVCIPITYSYRPSRLQKCGGTVCPLIPSRARAELPRRQTAGDLSNWAACRGGLLMCWVPESHALAVRMSPGLAQPSTTLRLRSRPVILLPRWVSFEPKCTAAVSWSRNSGEELDCGGVTSLARRPKVGPGADRKSMRCQSIED